MGEGRGGFGDDVTQDVVGFVQTRRTRACKEQGAGRRTEGRPLTFFANHHEEKEGISVYFN